VENAEREKVGKVGKAGKVGKVGREGREEREYIRVKDPLVLLLNLQESIKVKDHRNLPILRNPPEEERNAF
jgi:hypothetical protein